MRSPSLQGRLRYIIKPGNFLIIKSRFVIIELVVAL